MGHPTPGKWPAHPWCYRRAAGDSSREPCSQSTSIRPPRHGSPHKSMCAAANKVAGHPLSPAPLAHADPPPAVCHLDLEASGEGSCQLHLRPCCRNLSAWWGSTRMLPRSGISMGREGTAHPASDALSSRHPDPTHKRSYCKQVMYKWSSGQKTKQAYQMELPGAELENLNKNQQKDDKWQRRPTFLETQALKIHLVTALKLKLRIQKLS